MFSYHIKFSQFSERGGNYLMNSWDINLWILQKSYKFLVKKLLNSLCISLNSVEFCETLLNFIEIYWILRNSVNFPWIPSNSLGQIFLVITPSSKNLKKDLEEFFGSPAGSLKAHFKTFLSQLFSSWKTSSPTILWESLSYPAHLIRAIFIPRIFLPKI